MELLFFSVLTCLLFVIMVLKIGKGFKARDRSLNLPPGPWKLPIIGNLHQLAGFLPHHRLRNLANKYGPMMFLQIGEHQTIVVSSAELAKEVMQTHDLVFASRVESIATKILSYDFSGFAFKPVGDQWKELRKICVVGLLSKKRVQSFRSEREEEVSNIIRSIASNAGSVINLTDTVLSLTYNITSKIVFGNKCKEREIFISTAKEFVIASAGANIVDLFPSIKFLHFICGVKSQVEKIHQQLDRMLSNIVEEFKARLTNGKSEEDAYLVDVLLKAKENGNLQFPLTTNNIKAVIVEIFIASIDSSATTIDWALSEMIKNPRVLKKAQGEVREIFDRKGKIDEMGIEELQFLKLVIKETLRLHPAAPLLFPRECRERCEINGFDIPTKARVIVNAWAIGRDPKYWNEPERFIPERFLGSSIDFQGNNFEYIPFGAGRRICPGILFVIANIELALAMLLYHFDWKLPSGIKHEDLDMTETFGVTVKRKDDLFVIPTLYHPSPVE